MISRTLRDHRTSTTTPEPYAVRGTIDAGGTGVHRSLCRPTTELGGPLGQWRVSIPLSAHPRTSPVGSELCPTPPGKGDDEGHRRSDHYRGEFRDDDVAPRVRVRVVDGRAAPGVDQDGRVEDDDGETRHLASRGRVRPPDVDIPYSELVLLDTGIEPSPRNVSGVAREPARYPPGAISHPRLDHIAVREHVEQTVVGLGCRASVVFRVEHDFAEIVRVTGNVRLRSDADEDELGVVPAADVDV